MTASSSLPIEALPNFCASQDTHQVYVYMFTCEVCAM